MNNFIFSEITRVIRTIVELTLFQCVSVCVYVCRCVSCRLAPGADRGDVITTVWEETQWGGET